ncbi:alpha/beta hydrolase [Myroides pelagicus]|uniref:Alpha/beta fold hydrolase n=1 Tax=Myroides pelagicus TaxID=270914 RepID=A0A7K1GN32_9FLAO|nr:alpha/beta hydrolase [Myroides pelagicus]MEC4115123.1 alpha/beta hydrolase [Myroides pelagicus]MTH29624.1 alpha/beta fold hydrolase [Myroides pelagicus]
MDLHLTYKKYVTHQHPFPNDYDGRVVTTLIESRGNKPEFSKTVLYIHGFNDYFFQTHMMEYINANSINFFAIDLRKYGRSLLEGQHPNYCESMREYFPDIDYAVNFIFGQNKDVQFYLMGHSTGGLLATYYAKYGLLRNRLQGLLLNSPFLDFNVPFYVKPFIETVAKYKTSSNVFASIDSLPSLYGESLHKGCLGEWDFDLRYKPITPFPAFFSWILAVRQAQTLIKEAPNLGSLPILLMRSSLTGDSFKKTAVTFESDIVLNVQDMNRIGSKLSDRVEEAIFEGGVHDLVLSKKSIRTKVLETIVHFMQKEL